MVSITFPLINVRIDTKSRAEVINTHQMEIWAKKYHFGAKNKEKHDITAFNPKHYNLI